MLKRTIDSFLDNFFIENPQTGLFITGARQVGKTFSIMRLGAKFKSFIYINFIENPEARKLLSDDVDTKEILLRISSLELGELIEGETLICFDEVQFIPKLLEKLKFLVLDGKYHYVLSGSILGSKTWTKISSWPVGTIEKVQMFPLTFREFLLNAGVGESVFDEIEDAWKEKRPVDPFINSRLLKYLDRYLVVGGMPSVVQTFLDTNDLGKVMKEQKRLIAAYKDDIRKYASTDDYLIVGRILDLVHQEIDAQNKRFVMKDLKEGASFENQRENFLWLTEAAIAIPVFNVEEPRLPLNLSSGRRLLKLFQNDVGLLMSYYGMATVRKIISGEKSLNKGAIMENFIAEELYAEGYELFYFTSKKQGEIDFLIKSDNEVLPIEVKSGKDYKRHSALSNVLANDAYGIKRAIVFCDGNIEERGKVLYAPLYMVMMLKSQEEEAPVLDMDIKELNDVANKLKRD